MQLTICWYNIASFGQKLKQRCMLSYISAAYINHILRWSILPLNYYKAILEQYAGTCIVRICYNNQLYIILNTLVNSCKLLLRPFSLLLFLNLS